MTITGDKVILRDFLPEDIGKRIEWETVETEWQKWDAPWEYDGLTEAEKQQDLKRYVENMKRWAQPPPAGHERRWSFQICLNTQDRTYIGWCSAYRIDEAFRFARDGRYCAVGIDLPERWARGQGYAREALELFIGYLMENGEREIYTQTWSGNIPMIGLAARLGFSECNRIVGARTVEGKPYDALTFRLKMQGGSV